MQIKEVFQRGQTVLDNQSLKCTSDARFADFQDIVVIQ